MWKREEVVVGTSEVRIFDEADGGNVTIRGSVRSPPGTGPRHLQFHPSGTSLSFYNFIVHFPSVCFSRCLALPSCSNRLFYTAPFAYLLGEIDDTVTVTIRLTHIRLLNPSATTCIFPCRGTSAPKLERRLIPPFP
jgi:hypothetical protein